MAIQQLLRTYRDPDAEEQAQLRSANLLAAQSTPEAIAKKEAEAKKTSNIDALTQQILAQNTTDKWTGEGYGGAEANAKAMAKLLADAGITDIKQFGKVDKYEPVEVVGYSLNGKTIQRPNNNTYYEMVYAGETENGPEYNRRDLTPQEIAQVKPTYGVVDSAGDADNPAVIRPASNVVERDGKLVGVTGQTWGNKATGQAVNRGTGRWERQGGDDLFSGTGEGDGNTGFRVQMSPDGTPVFYTTKGSSSDLADIMPIIQFGLMATGAGGLLGNALLGAGANQLAASALGGALIGGGSAALTGDSILQGALRGGAGGALSNVLGEALSSGDVSNVTSAGEINAASDIASNMADQGMSIGEINQQLQSVGYQPDAINFALEDALQIFSANNPLQTWGDVAPPIDGEFNWTDPTATPVAVTPTVEFQGPMPNVEVTAPSAPTVAPTLGDVISAIVATPQTPVAPPIENIEVVAPQAPKEVTQEVVPTPKLEDIIASIPELVMTANAPTTQQENMEAPIIVAPPIDTTLPEVTTIAERPSTITNEVPPAPVIVAPPIDTALPEKSYTTKEIIDMIRLGTLGASILGAGAAATQDSEPTGFDIVPVPTDWTSPTAPKATDFTPLAPIDFGTRDLLKGTQWEKFLDPNYGKAPAPVEFNKPSDMSYDRLMSILGSGRDTLPSQALTINDVISGIQNQYGQIPTSSMGQKPA